MPLSDIDIVIVCRGRRKVSICREKNKGTEWERKRDQSPRKAHLIEKCALVSVLEINGKREPNYGYVANEKLKPGVAIDSPCTRNFDGRKGVSMDVVGHMFVNLDGFSLTTGFSCQETTIMNASELRDSVVSFGDKVVKHQSFLNVEFQ